MSNELLIEPGFSLIKFSIVKFPAVNWNLITATDIHHLFPYSHLIFILLVSLRIQSQIRVFLSDSSIISINLILFSSMYLAFPLITSQKLSMPLWASFCLFVEPLSYSTMCSSLGILSSAFSIILIGLFLSTCTCYNSS